MSKSLKFIEGKDLSLEDFIEMLLSPAQYLLNPNNQFPTDEMLNEFLLSAKDRPDQEVKNILHAFFMKNSTFKIDLIYKESYKGMDWEKYNATPEVYSNFTNTEYYKRLMDHDKTTDSIWEGITWIIDLLPHFPNEALNALNAWFLANCQFMPDSYFSAYRDWAAIIRARYVDIEVAQDVLVNFKPQEFEYLTAELYEKLGYKTELTKSSYDGGVDVIAVKENVGAKETLIIQCKRKRKYVGVKEIRELLGVVSDRRATKGALVASCRFSPQAKKFANSNARIELIDNEQLTRLLNLHFGPFWVTKRDMYLMNQKKKMNLE